MKSLKFIGMAIMMVLLAGCFTACSSDDNESDGSGDASDAASTLTSCVWQLYKAMDDEYGEPDFNEMEIVDSMATVSVLIQTGAAHFGIGVKENGTRTMC